MNPQGSLSGNSQFHPLNQDKSHNSNCSQLSCQQSAVLGYHASHSSLRNFDNSKASSFRVSTVYFLPTLILGISTKYSNESLRRFIRSLVLASYSLFPLCPWTEILSWFRSLFASGLGSIQSRSRLPDDDTVLQGHILSLTYLPEVSAEDPDTVQASP